MSFLTKGQFCYQHMKIYNSVSGYSHLAENIAILIPSLGIVQDKFTKDAKQVVIGFEFL